MVAGGFAMDCFCLEEERTQKEREEETNKNKKELKNDKEIILGKLYIWSLSFIPYFNLASNFSIVSIWFLTFQCRVDLVLAIIF